MTDGRDDNSLINTYNSDIAESQSSSPKAGAGILEPLYKRDKLFLSVIILSLAIVLSNIAYIYFNPPVDGDSYEYAGVARNFLRYGKLLETHVNINFPFSVQSLPQPSVIRAKLWAFILLPFQALFGNSFWTFVIPLQISVFLLGPVVFLFAYQYFSRKIAFASAIAIILNPRILIWATREDPGNSDIFATILFILATLFFLKRRWLLTGILTGVTFLTKINGLIFIPLFTFWLFLFDRKEFLRRGFYIFILSTVVCCSPLLIRNTLLFGDPLYGSVESYRSQSDKFIKKILLAKEDKTLVWLYFDNLLNEDDDRNKAEKSVPMSNMLKFKYRLEFLYLNFKAFFFGEHNGISWYPGFFETLTLVLAPFLFLGAWRCRGDTARFMIVLFISVHLITLVPFKVGFEDRYLFPSLPFGAILAFYGVEHLAKSFKWLSVKNVLIMFILIETIPALGMSALNAMSNEERSLFVELQAMCKWVKDETPEDAVLMTVPFWSPHYYCDRYTVPPTSGNLEKFKKVIEQHHVGYFLFYEPWGGDRVPRFTYMEPIIRGRFLTLYRIDRSHPDFRNMGGRYAYMKDFGYLHYFWEGRLTFKAYPSILEVFCQLTKSIFSGIVIFLLVCIFALRSISTSGKWKRFACYAVLTVALLICRIAAIMPFVKTFHLTPPPVSRYQTEHFLSGENAHKKIKRVIIKNGGDRQEIELAFSHIGLESAPESETPKNAVENGDILFAAIKERSRYISSLERAREAASEMQMENKQYEKVRLELERSGYRAEPIGGGVLGIKDRN